MLECIREGKKGVLIDIRVIPNSKKEGLGYDKFGKRLKLRISSPATDGRANKQLIRIFSDLFGNCEIISGKFSRKKTILVRNWDIEHISRILGDRLDLGDDLDDIY